MLGLEPRAFCLITDLRGVCRDTNHELYAKLQPQDSLSPYLPLQAGEFLKGAWQLLFLLSFLQWKGICFCAYPVTPVKAETLPCTCTWCLTQDLLHVKEPKFTESSLCVWHCANCCACCYLFSLHNSPTTR